jgi:aminopeptidase N
LNRVPALGVAALIFLSAPTAAADAPFRFDSTPGRLPKTVVPRDYRLTIIPHPRELTLDGTEHVTLDVRRPTATLVFNALNLRFSQARVDGGAVASITPDDREQRATVRLARPLAPGRHVLDLAFTGRLETEPQGMFRQSYAAPGGSAATLLATQFESTDARRMFACWDEPAFRATFALSIVIPAGWQAVSNMPVVARTRRGPRATIAFARTPAMPTYLLEVTAGDIAALRGADAGGTRHEIWAVRGRERQGVYALANSKQILADYDAYFGVRFPLPRLASIAVPGGFPGAMENWGAIVYNDQLLLLDRDPGGEQEQTIYSVQAHEMAHQWFGDLVTPAWWDDLWLNESFASWMAAKQTAAAHPAWRWWQNQDADKEVAMNADAFIHTHPIEQPVADDTEAEAAFDSEITYAKGQAFLRMLEAYVGARPFRSGIRTYVRRRAYSNATAADLWSALEAGSGKPVEALARAWIRTAGFPLVTVTATCGPGGLRTIALRQDRFLITGAGGAHPLWTIPVGIASGSSAPTYILLTQRERAGIAAGRCGEPLRANAGNLGFYRVAYDAPSAAANRAAFRALPADDKIEMLDDAWALASAGKARLDAYFALVSALGGDQNPRAWEQIAGALAAIDRDERGLTGQSAFEAYARGALAPLAVGLGFDPQPGDSPARAKLRHEMLSDLGAWGDSNALDWARLQFTRIEVNRESVGAADQAVALRIVAEHADAATFERLIALVRSARGEAEFARYSRALAAVRDPRLAAKVLQIALSAAFPAQAESERLHLVFAVASGHPALAYRFLKANADRLFELNSVEESVAIAQEIPELFWDAAPVAEVAAWVKARTPPQAAPELARGTERATFHRLSRARLDAQADAFTKTVGTLL